MSFRTYLIVASVVLLAVACGNGNGDTSGSQPQTGGDAAPTSTPAPAPADDGLSLQGAGNQTSTVDLDEGQWAVNMTVQDNEDCSSGSCIEGKFTVEIESESGGTLNVPANETTTAWSGSATIGVGTGLLDLAPGAQKVTVTAKGSWTITFSPK